MTEAAETEWELVRTHVLYNMASSAYLALDIRDLRNGRWEVERLPFSSDIDEDDVDEGVPSFWNGLSTGPCEPLELYREVTDTHGYSESYYGFSYPKEFLDALRKHGSKRLAALADEIEEAERAEEAAAASR
jgi:hypothetical protein